LIQASAVSGPAVAAVLLSLILLAGCKQEEKKTDTKTYAAPQLRSESQRSAAGARGQGMQATGGRPALRMGKSQVEGLLGKPDVVNIYTYPGESETIEEWRYAEFEKGCRLVQFTNGKVSMLRDCVASDGPSGVSSP
jgi:outer membrane murein-binding lipoprotein Lpp